MACVGIYSINYVVVCMRPEMATDFDFTKWNRCWVSGLAMDNPLFCFGTVKNSPCLYELDQKCSCVVCLKLFEVNGLSWLIKEINRY